MRAETRETAEEKIRQLRAEISKDKAEKSGKPARRAGDLVGPADGNEPGGDEGATSKAGGDQRVRFWEVPEEFEVDYTKQEDLQRWVQGPDKDWGIPVAHQDREYRRRRQSAREGCGIGEQGEGA